MTYEEREELLSVAIKDAYKEIDAAIEAMFRQGTYIEKHANLLKALRGHSLDDTDRILDLHLGVVRNQLQSMLTALNDLREQYDRHLERQKEMEDATRNNVGQATCRG